MHAPTVNTLTLLMFLTKVPFEGGSVEILPTLKSGSEPFDEQNREWVKPLFDRQLSNSGLAGSDAVTAWEGSLHGNR